MKKELALYDFGGKISSQGRLRLSKQRKFLEEVASEGFLWLALNPALPPKS